VFITYFCNKLIYFCFQSRRQYWARAHYLIFSSIYVVVSLTHSVSFFQNVDFNRTYIVQMKTSESFCIVGLTAHINIALTIAINSQYPHILSFRAFKEAPSQVRIWCISIIDTKYRKPCVVFSATGTKKLRENSRRHKIIIQNRIMLKRIFIDDTAHIFYITDAYQSDYTLVANSSLHCAQRWRLLRELSSQYKMYNVATRFDVRLCYYVISF